MAYNDFVTNIMNADTDALAFQRFMQGAPSEIVKRRIAGDTKTLAYFLAFLQGLELVYSQQTGEVDVNGVKVKTVTQAIKDAINTAGVANGVNANLVTDGTRTQKTINDLSMTKKLVDTRLYGVVANTEADQTAAIHAAFAANPTCNNFYIPSGTIKANIVYPRAYINLVGDSMLKTVLQPFDLVEQ